MIKMYTVPIQSRKEYQNRRFFFFNFKTVNYILGGMAARWIVAKNIWQYMVSICAAYFVTLSLYPGIISEIKSCAEDHWFPVLLMTLFNGTDLIGKVNER